MANAPIFQARTADQITRCYPVMQQLRPHLTQQDFVAQVLRQQQGGFLLAGLEAAQEVKAVAGYRIQEMLAHGRILYVDDLITLEEERSRGWGRQLFEWLVQEAKARECVQLQLDSGTFRHGAHRFYFRQGMHISSYHFDLEL
ncbi:MAG: GNAT family N-acetyltransferase [Bacteroidetes bacterium]|nr:GNAT family N-acetyltransferase [Bacteroidota bacterium]